MSERANRRAPAATIANGVTGASEKKPSGSNPDLTRREALILLGAAGAATLAGCPASTNDNANSNGSTDGDNTNGNSTGNANTNSTPDCVVTPEQTEGPYFVDELLNRSDIRSNPATGAVQAGTLLRLRITAAEVNGDTCSPLAGATVDVWHCNSQGLYSDVAANGTVGQKFLRGYQVTDADGVVEFTTIYPGWYSGRTVHIHFKVRSGDLEFNSQLYFDEAVTGQVYEAAPYAARGEPDITNSEDNIYTDETLLNLSTDDDGYLGTFDVGLRLS